MRGSEMMPPFGRDALPLIAVVLTASLAFSVASASPSVLWADSPIGPYLKTPIGDAPDGLSPRGLSAALTSLLGLPPPFSLDEPTANELRRLLSDDVFERPKAVLSIGVAGVGAGEGDANLTKPIVERAAGGGSFLVQVEAGQNGMSSVLGAIRLAAESTARWESGQLLVLDPFGIFAADCSSACLELALGEAIQATGGSYKPADNSFTGRITMASGHTIKLAGNAMRHWGREIGSLWEATTRVSQLLENGEFGAGPALLESTLMGLQLVSAEQPGASPDFPPLVSLTGDVLKMVYSEFYREFDGKLVLAFTIHGNAGSSESGSSVEELLNVATAHHRSLLQDSGANSTNGSSGNSTFMTERDAYIPVFSTEAAAFGVFLMILFALFGAMYCMLNMKFKQDTLLYSRSKTD